MLAHKELGPSAFPDEVPTNSPAHTSHPQVTIRTHFLRNATTTIYLLFHPILAHSALAFNPTQLHPFAFTQTILSYPHRPHVRLHNAKSTSSAAKVGSVVNKRWVC